MRKIKLLDNSSENFINKFFCEAKIKHEEGSSGFDKKLTFNEDEDFVCYKVKGYLPKFINKNNKDFFKDIESWFFNVSKMNRGYAIYIFINLDKNGCSYIGHSSNVVYRLKEHVHFRHIMRRSPINEVINKEDSNFELYIIGFNRSWALYAKIWEFLLITYKLNLSKGFKLAPAEEREVWTTGNFASLLRDKAFMADRGFKSTDPDNNGLYNIILTHKNDDVSLLPIRPFLKGLERSLKVYSCYYCKESGNYIPLRKFNDVKGAADYYKITQKDIRHSIGIASHPQNGKLWAPSLNIVYDSISKETKPVSFFKFEGGAKFTKPLICYTQNDIFVGYFNNPRSAAQFLGVTEPRLTRHILSLEDYEKYLLNIGGRGYTKSLVTPYDHSFKLYYTNLSGSGLPSHMKGDFFKGSLVTDEKGDREFIKRSKNMIYDWVVEDCANGRIRGSYRTLNGLLEEWNISQATAYRCNKDADAEINYSLKSKKIKIKVYKRFRANCPSPNPKRFNRG